MVLTASRLNTKVPISSQCSITEILRPLRSDICHIGFNEVVKKVKLLEISWANNCKMIKECNRLEVGETLDVVGGLGKDRAPGRLIANPNIQRLKAMLEDTQAVGGVKIPCFARKCLAVNISLSPSVTDGTTRPLRALRGIGLRKTRVLTLFTLAN